jgi:FkbM family methyltransferase
MGIASVFLGPGYIDEVALSQGLLPATQGCMLDVGAHFGESHASQRNSWWKVIALEPDPENRAKIPTHKNLTIDPRAVSSKDGEKLTLYKSPVSSGITSLAPFHETHEAALEVETVRLDTLLKEHGDPRVTYVKVDTEGFDLPVLQTFPWDTQHPQAIVCEFEDRKSVPLGYTYRDLGDLLVDQGYVVFMSEWHPIVEYGQTHRYRRTVQYPAEVMDPDAWGNFVAVVPELAKRYRKALRAAEWQLAAHRKYAKLRNRQSA